LEESSLFHIIGFLGWMPLVSCFSFNIVSSVGWYEAIRASGDITCNRPLFIKKGGMILGLGDDSTYLMRGVGYISFWTPSSDVLELSNI